MIFQKHLGQRRIMAARTGADVEGGPLRAAGAAANRYAAAVMLAMLALVIWQAVAFLTSVQDWLLPAPTEIAEALRDDFGLISRHAWVTTQEALVGFAAAVVIGFGIAVAIAYSPLLDRALYPYVIASQAIPIIALAPVLVVWFGFGLFPKVVVIVLITFFPIAINTVDGLRRVDPEMLTLMHTMGASRWQVFRLVRLPSALPLFFTGAKMAAAVAVIGAVLGEWVGAADGLGYLITRSSAQFLTARVFASIAVLCVMGIVLFYTVSRVERWATPWAHRAERIESPDL